MWACTMVAVLSTLRKLVQLLQSSLTVSSVSEVACWCLASLLVDSCPEQQCRCSLSWQLHCLTTVAFRGQIHLWCGACYPATRHTCQPLARCRRTCPDARAQDDLVPCTSAALHRNDLRRGQQDHPGEERKKYVDSIISLRFLICIISSVHVCQSLRASWLLCSNLQLTAHLTASASIAANCTVISTCFIWPLINTSFTHIYSIFSMQLLCTAISMSLASLGE